MQKAIDQSIEYLKSESAENSIKQDPYWPKWNSPWWHMLVLFELDLTEKIPGKIINLMAEKIDSHYLHSFPLIESELPEGIDTYREIMCFCACGSIMQIFCEYGYDYKKKFPWVCEWIEKYQLPDGGYNCEEGAYTASKKSSVNSTLPVLELLIRDNALLSEEKRKEILIKGFKYLKSKNLIYSSKDPEKVMDPDFFIPTFPRYYYYDIIRGLKFMVDFITEFPEYYEKNEFDRWLLEAKACLNNIKCNSMLETQTLFETDGKWLDQEGKWMFKATSKFPLLEYFNQVDNVILIIERELKKLVDRLEKIDEQN